jgi:hypothetical protein
MKTRLFTRKRALISSVAMLLVAMIALGTATFAWFTSNPLAEASGLTLKATASKGLVIQTATHGASDSSFWGHTDYLNYDSGTQKSSTTVKELTPTSFDTATSMSTGYSVEAKADDNYIAADDATVAEAPSSSYYQETIKCKLTGATSDSDKSDLKITGLTVTTTSATQASGIRVALQYTSGSTTTLIGVYAPSEKTNKVLTKTGTYSTALSSTTTTFAAPTAAAKKIGEVGTTGEDYITVTVYLDGEDANVYSQSISASNLVTAVKLNLSVAD